LTVDRNIPVEFTVKNTYDVTDTRFIEVTIKLMHTEENYNGSYFSKDIVASAIPSLANTPILAYLEENKNDEIDYSDHRQVLVEENNIRKIKYLGQAIGVIPETNNARFEKYLASSGIEREYLVVDGLLWTKWDDPIDIIQRDTKHQQSMEIHKNYQGRFEKDNLFHFTYFQFFGACALSNIDILPAMEDASIELKFNMEDFKQEIQDKMEQFKNFTIQNQSSTSEVDDINKNEEGGTGMTQEILDIVETEVIEEFSTEIVTEEVIEETTEETTEFYTEKEVVEAIVDETVVEEVFEAVTEIIEEVVDNTPSEYEILYSKYEDLLEEYSIYKVDFEKVKSEKEIIESDFAKLKEKNDSLKEFKLAKETLDKEEVFSQFEGLTDEDVADIKVNIADYTVESLEEKLFAIWGKKKMELEQGKTFTKKNKDKKDKLVFSIMGGVQEDQDAPIYVDIINKHKKIIN